MLLSNMLIHHLKQQLEAAAVAVPLATSSKGKEEANRSAVVAVPKAAAPPASTTALVPRAIPCEFLVHRWCGGACVLTLLSSCR
jgi:hypothetical protein